MQCACRRLPATGWGLMGKPPAERVAAPPGVWSRSSPKSWTLSAVQSPKLLSAWLSSLYLLTSFLPPPAPHLTCIRCILVYVVIQGFSKLEVTISGGSSQQLFFSKLAPFSSRPAGPGYTFSPKIIKSPGALIWRPNTAPPPQGSADGKVSENLTFSESFGQF